MALVSFPPVPGLTLSLVLRTLVTLLAAEGGGALPTVTDVSPTPGTALQRNAAVTFTVADDTGLESVLVWVTLGSDAYMVYDGTRFLGAFGQSTFQSLGPNSVKLTVRRNGGWRLPPTFTIRATDNAAQVSV